MKFGGGSDSGPFAPNTASWICLIGSRVPGQHDAVRGVESLHQGAPGLTEWPRQLPVDPDLRVVVDDDFEDDGRARGVERRRRALEW